MAKICLRDRADPLPEEERRICATCYRRSASCETWRAVRGTGEVITNCSNWSKGRPHLMLGPHLVETIRIQ
jgi:hypothetical protein